MADSPKTNKSKANKPAISKSRKTSSAGTKKTAQSKPKKTETSAKTSPVKKTRQQSFSMKPEKSMLRYEIELITLFALTILSAVAIHTQLTGFFGELLKGIYLGLFGFSGTLLPYLIFFVIFFRINKFFSDKKWRLIFATLTGFLSVWFFSTTVNYTSLYELLAKQGQILMSSEGMRASVDQGLALRGGGVFGNIIVFGLINAIGKFGTYLLATLLAAFAIVLAFKVSLTNWVKKSGIYTYKGLKPVAGKLKEVPKQMAKVVDETKLRNEVAKRAQELQNDENALPEVPPEQKINLADLPRMEKPIETFNSDLYFEDSIKEPALGEAALNEEIASEINSTQPLYSLGEETIDQETGEYIKLEDPQLSTPLIRNPEEVVVHFAIDDEDVLREEIPTVMDEVEISAEYEVTEAYEATENLGISEEVGVSPNFESSNEFAVTDELEAFNKPVALNELKVSSKIEPIEQATVVKPPAPKPYQLPPLSLLNPAKPKANTNKDEIVENVKILEVTMKNFGVDAKVTEVTKGPAITMYEVLPAPGVKVSKIVNLTDDIALALAASQIRIIAPIPGKSAIGIEIPNKDTTMVTAREVFESEEFKKTDSRLSFALGKDITGKTMVADLAKMPHMLIAGSTGSGKSVCVNTIINSILFNSKPDEVKLLMIDPKVVELSHYNGIPHLILPVVVDPKKASIALNWAVNEMTNRYKAFAEQTVKDINTYNRKAETQPELKLEKMAKIVIIVDELADLMMVAPNQVEDAICRLAQMARAAGIHLIVATQRPSVDVITGTIKANIPSRIAFAVSSQIDSRTILDMAGAEKLLGKGDMLFYPLGANKPIRIQGAFLADQEVEGVVEFVKNQGTEVTYQEEILADIPDKGSPMEADELLPEAIDMVVESGQASISMVQRKFRVGYNRAARLIDQMEERGIIGPSLGSKPREVLVTKLELEQMKG